MTEQVKVVMPVGFWSPRGHWTHNPALRMSAFEQYQYNVKHGFIKEPKS